MTEQIALETVHSERVGLLERIVIERVYEAPQEPAGFTPMLHTNYDALTLEEKVERLEHNAQLYLGWLGNENPAFGMREDCTRYWEEMLHVKEVKPDV